MPLSRRAFAFPVLVASFAVGCGTEPGPRVSEATRKALPTHQYLLSEEVCPGQLGMPAAMERRTRRRGQRQLRALLKAYRRNPDAVVRTSWAASDELPRLRHEDVTVGELLETHLSTAELLSEGDEPTDACFRRVARKLRAAKEGE